MGIQGEYMAGIVTLTYITNQLTHGDDFDKYNGNDQGK